MPYKYVLLPLLFCFYALGLSAQDKPIRDLPALPTQEADTLAPALQPADTALVQDTVRMQLPPQPQRKQGDIETKINYGAKDSSRMDVPNNKVFLYGDAYIEYGTIKLQAAQIAIDWKTNTLTAVGVKDSTDKVQGKPVFTDGPETYVTDKIKYNFKTRQAFIRGVVTQQEDGYIHGDWVKKDAEDNLYVGKAKYTTCNLEEPHFEIAASKLKYTGDKVVAGPFNLRIANINTPLGFLFGMFPQPRERTSGIIMPSYGEENRRGFFLRQGGYYFALNDYVDLAMTGEIYTKGSRGLQLASNYRKRYRYSGNFNVRYNRNVTGNEGSESISNGYWVTWSHSPQSRGTSRFSASVNAGSTSYTQENPSLNNLERNLNQQFNSNVSWNKTFPNSPFSMGARANLVQDIQSGTVDLTLPDVSLTMNRIYPFKPKSGSSKGLIRQLNFSYTGTATNKLTNRRTSNITGLNGVDILNEAPATDEPLNFSVGNFSSLWARSANGVRHSIPVSTSVNVFKYFTLSPSFNYNEIWNFRKLQFTDYDPELDGIRVDTTSGFYRSSSWNVGSQLSTRVYGTFFFGKRKENPNLQAIRHMIVPSLGFSYAPDNRGIASGNFQEVLVGYDDNDEPIYNEVAIFQGTAYTPPSSGPQGNINFSLSNNIEMKIRDKKDTVEVTYKKVPLLERFSVNSSYNLIADSLNLSDISFSGNTRLFNNLVTVQFGGRLNPYQYRLDSTYFSRGELRVNQTRINRYVWEDGGLPRLENVNFNVSTSFSSKGAGSKSGAQQPNAGNRMPNQGRDDLGQGVPLGDDMGEEALAYRYDDPNVYVDFNLPWSLRVNYTFQYSKRGMAVSDVTQSMNFSGDLKLTEKWKIGFNSAYNFEEKDFTSATRLSIFRDLHCWQMDVNWVPFGPYQSFSVDIRVKAPTLQDLKLSRRRSFWDN